MSLDQIIPYLPHFQAVLNATATLLLVFGFLAISNKNRETHRRCMIGALTVSAIFMISYLTYHAEVGYAPFAGQGLIRPIYFTMLASHVILAAVIVPLVILTVYFAMKANFSKHPKLARWTLPLWLYVSVSGVLIYVLGFHIYKPSV